MLSGSTLSTLAPEVLAQLGSPTALAVIGVAGAAALTAYGAKIIYDRWLDAQALKRLEEINAINALWERDLKQIRVPGYEGVCPGFPQIFKVTSTGEKKANFTVDSMHFTPDQLESFGSKASMARDPALSKYALEIDAATQCIKRWAMKRGKKNKKKYNDATAGVLSYLLQMINLNCTGLEGREIDIAILQALCKFLSSYKSMQGSIRTEHFSRLDKVQGHLLAAMDALRVHHRARSLGNKLTELYNYAEASSIELLKQFAQMITPESKWDLIETATLEDLSREILEPAYVTRRLGFYPRDESETKLPNSPLTEWLSRLARYAFGVISHDSVSDKDKKLFFLPDLALVHRIQEKSPHKRSEDERTYLNKSLIFLKGTKDMFAQSKNFITTALVEDPNTGKHAFVSLTDIKMIYERLEKVVLPFAGLTHRMISLLAQTDDLYEGVRQLGEISMKNPRHAVFVFDVQQALFNQIRAEKQKIEEAIRQIQSQNHYIGRLEKQESFPSNILSHLDKIESILKQLVEEIKRYRDESSGNTADYQAEIRTVKNRLFSTAEELEVMYGLNCPLPTSQQGSMNSPVTPYTTAPVRAASTPPLSRPNFWQRNRYRIFIGIVVGVTLLGLLLVGMLSFFSGGLLSPLAAMLATLGCKLGVAAVHLAWMDALFGGALGAIIGAFTGGTILASTEAKDRYAIDYQALNDELLETHAALNKDGQVDNSGIAAKENPVPPVGATATSTARIIAAGGAALPIPPAVTAVNPPPPAARAAVRTPPAVPAFSPRSTTRRTSLVPPPPISVPLEVMATAVVTPH